MRISVGFPQHQIGIVDIWNLYAIAGQELNLVVEVDLDSLPGELLCVSVLGSLSMRLG